MSPSTPNSVRPDATANSASKPAATWVRGKRTPKRRRTDGASALQLGAIDLASNHHA